MSNGEGAVAMVRLTRLQQQRRTRDAVLSAAHSEFYEFGYVGAKIDRIADRADLTRGAIYSNFQSKRALYLAVLNQLSTEVTSTRASCTPESVEIALGAFARAWLKQVPLPHAPEFGERVDLRSLVSVTESQAERDSLAQVLRLASLLLALGLESVERTTSTARMVRVAELAIALLGGASLLNDAAPGFGDPFDRAAACEHLARMNLPDTWDKPHLPYTRAAVVASEAWTPPADVLEAVSGEPLDAQRDGVVLVLGFQQVSAAEDAVRSISPDDKATIVVVSGEPQESGQLMTLYAKQFIIALREVFPAGTWKNLSIVFDLDGSIARSLGIQDFSDHTLSAFRIRNGEIMARSEGHGAVYAVSVAESLGLDVGEFRIADY